ncbi:MAG TPA: hypothetical protein VFG99_06190 [Chloroflexia bacterium]|nr:hypothetical protein [Chloroflexia bacterium]
MIVVAAIAIEAFFYLIDALPWSWIGAVWVLGLLLGPLATGVVFGYLRKPWPLGAATWALVGLFALLVDWILLNEDQLFHLAQAIVTAVLVAIGNAIGWVIRRLQRRDTTAHRPVQ